MSPQLNILSVAPELILLTFGIALVLMEAFSKRERAGGYTYISIIGLLISLFPIYFMWNRPGVYFYNMLVIDNYSLFFFLLFAIVGIIAVLIADPYLKREEVEKGEYYGIVLFCIVGMMLMASGNDLIVIFLGLETMSVGLYVLAGFLKADIRSNEAAIKYFLMGAFASAFLLYGIAIIYGIVGSTNVADVGSYIKEKGLFSNPALFVSLSLILVGFGFKVSAFPFHMWTPDVYEGSPTSVTAFMSTGPKAAGFAAFLRVFYHAFGPVANDWIMVIWIISVLTMSIGNIVALVQENIKRMLAYSSIAHAGYILMGFVVCTSELGRASVLFYLLAYIFMELGAFAVVAQYGKKGEENLSIKSYSGMAYKYPLLAATMTVFMLSLAGIPPLAGFVGKFYIFSAAIKEGFIWLAVIAVINSLISVYYYLRVTVMMYMKEPEAVPTFKMSPAMVIALVITALGTIQIGILPSFYLNVVKQSIAVFM